MKAKLITSGLLGLMLPWTYFLVVKIGPIRTHDQFGEVSFGASGVLGFIEFIGLTDAILIYTKAVLACTLAVFLICVVYDAISGKYSSTP